MGIKVKSTKYNIYIFFLKMIKILPLQTSYLLLSTVINALLPAVQALAVAEFINTAEIVFEGTGAVSEVIWPLAIMLVVVIFQNIMPSAANLINQSAQNRLKLVLKKQFVQKQTLLKYYYIEDETSSALIHRVCEEPEKRFEQGFQNICDGIGLVVKCISLLSIVVRASWISGFAILAISIPLFYIAMKTGEKNYSLQSDALELKRRYQYLADILTNREYAKERAIFGYNAHIENEYDSFFKEANQKEARIEKKRYANMKSGSITTILLSIIIMFMLLPALREGRISNGLYVGLVSAVLNLVQSMSWNLSRVMQGYAGTKAYLEDVGTFWNMGEKEDADVEPQEIKDFRLHTIEFRHVSFRYPGAEEYVLRDCSFTLRGDKCYSVVGRNGAGKSTVTRLLMGLYDDFEGEILINGRHIQEYRYAEIKWMISVVFQDFARYALSVQDNIFLGNMKHRDTNVLERISRELEMDDFVQKLPQGMESMLGKVEKGSVDLSGGEWQKLAIARLLYRESPINILDEPTAALDPKAEAKVYETFQKVNREHFTIFITHRLGAARLADEILVLDQGRIVEQGTHEQLLTHENGLYKDMFESQRSWYEA